MPRTEISQNQIRPVDPSRVAACEKRFSRFFFVALAYGVIALISMFIPIPTLQAFWNGHRIWTIGSSLVCISVLHSRFFDIKKNAAPHNERLDASSLSPTWNLIEKVIAHIWLLGFILLAVARWNDR